MKEIEWSFRPSNDPGKVEVWYGNQKVGGIAQIKLWYNMFGDSMLDMTVEVAVCGRDGNPL